MIGSWSKDKYHFALLSKEFSHVHGAFDGCEPGWSAAEVFWKGSSRENGLPVCFDMPGSSQLWSWTDSSPNLEVLSTTCALNSVVCPLLRRYCEMRPLTLTCKDLVISYQSDPVLSLTLMNSFNSIFTPGFGNVDRLNPAILLRIRGPASSSGMMVLLTS